MIKVIYSFLIWRILLFLPVLFSQSLIPFRAGFEYTSRFHFGPLLSAFGNFDGLYYLTIAKAGYTVDNSGFFPLYPLLIRFFSVGESSIQFYVALILSSVFFLLACIAFYKLLEFDFSKNVALLSVLFFLIFPTSFFGVSIYAEALFLLLTFRSFYYARKKNWLLASLFAALLTATRFVGIAIIPALIYEFWKNEKSLFKQKVLPLLLTPLGILLYMYSSFHSFGNWFQFFKAQGALHNSRSVESVVLFPQTIFRYFKILTTLSSTKYEWWVASLELSAFVFASLMIYIAWKKKIRTSYLIYSIFALLIPASSGTFTGMPRYVLVIFPIFMVLSLLKNKYLKIIYSVVSIILLITLLILFSRGYYIS